MSEVTVANLEDLAKRMNELRAEVEVAKKSLAEKNEALEEVENKFLGYLKELGKTSYKSNFGTVSRVQKWRVNLPNTPEAKQEFFAYLKARGIFEELITVNSQTLNSFYMQEWEQVKEHGDPEEAMHFRVPGINEPKLHEIISFRKK